MKGMLEARATYFLAEPQAEGIRTAHLEQVVVRSFEGAPPVEDLA